MGCKQSVEVISGGDGNDTKVTDDLHNVVNDRQNDNHIVEQQNQPLLHTENNIVPNIDNNENTPSRQSYDVDHDDSVANSKDQHQQHHDRFRLDDFTKDYVILKKVMGGTSALSNIYMVMKRPKDDVQQKEDQQEQQEPQSGTDIVDNTTTTTTDDNVYVLQVIDMDSVAPERRKAMRKEIHSLKTIVHPNILRVLEVYDATRRDNTISTITELCTGSHLHSNVPYPEPRAKKIIAQILDALLYMHQRGLFHNSLTTENILFQDDSQDAIVKITYAGVTNLQSTHGRFAIPEWNQQGKDIYSVGMIAYKLLSGGKEPPTDMDTQRVVPGTNLFLGRRWKLISISKNAKNFIEKCLHSWDTKPQFTVEHALQHIWMTQEHVHRSDTSRPTETKMNDVVVTKWNPVASSLTVSEPIIHNSQSNESIPVVSLTAEQYSRDVKSKSETIIEENNVNPNDIKDTVVDDISVFMPITTPEHEVVESILTTDDNNTNDIPDETTPHEPIDDVIPNNPISNVPSASSETDMPIIVADTTNNQSTSLNVTEQPSTVNEKVVEVVDVNNDDDNNNNNNNLSKVPEQSSITEDDDDDMTDVDNTPEELIELRNALDEVTAENNNNNSNGNGIVTIDTLKQRLRTRYTEEEVNSWFQNEKSEDTRNMNYKVFLKKVIQNRKTIEIQRVDAAFKKIDKGRHGYVTVGNLRAVLDRDNIKMNDNIEQIIKAADTNRDGRISYENFEHVVQNLLSTTTTSTTTTST